MFTIQKDIKKTKRVEITLITPITPKNGKRQLQFRIYICGIKRDVEGYVTLTYTNMFNRHGCKYRFSHVEASTYYSKDLRERIAATTIGTLHKESWKYNMVIAINAIVRMLIEYYQ